MVRFPPALAATLALAACAGTPILPADLAHRLAEAPGDHAARLELLGSDVRRFVLPLQPVELPPAARTGVEAVAPRGELQFVGREWGPRGEGYRVDKRYDVEGVEHTRSVLVESQGRVLERSHSVPIAEVPAAVLTTAARFGFAVERIEIVAGATREEYWQCLVADRSGRRFVVRTELDGTLRECLRRLPAQLDG